MANPATYREKKRENSVKNYLNGEARKPYVLREDIAHGLVTRAKDRVGGKKKKNDSLSCGCEETLGQFADLFKNMVHRDRKSANQSKVTQKGAPRKTKRNLKKQNEWLLTHVFDSYGNYLFCFSCIKTILGVGGTRLHRLREIKRQQMNTPKIRVRKDQVSEDQMHHVVAPVEGADVLTWWLSLSNDSIVELRSPPKLHRGKSNNSKEMLLRRFLTFIDKNSQPNGRRIGSHGPLFFLNSKFDHINAPSKREEGKSEEWKRRSLVYEFNRTLEGDKSISNGTAKKWLKTHRPKHAISPKKTDYCKMCAECREQKRRYETISMRLQQNGNSDDDKVRENQALAESYGILLEEHKMDAGYELQHYREKTAECRNLYRTIEKLRKKSSKKKGDGTKRRGLEKKLVFCLSVDYQQSKLTPHWGFSAQPSETYYLRKLSHNIFGIVDHTLGEDTVYVLDERVGGAKNGDITISLVDNYINEKLPSWARRLCLFMDNGATNKNQFMIQWGIELIERGDFDSFRMCFFVPGHAKNDADRLFSRISQSYKNNDVFITEHFVKLIGDTIGPSGSCINMNNRGIVNWEGLLAKKYSSFKNIKSYRDFLIKRNDQEKVIVYHKACCYHGEYEETDLLKKKTDASLDLRKEVFRYTYESKGMSKDLSEEKMEDLVKMYDKFIDPILRPEWLPASKSVTLPHASDSSPSSELARLHRADLKKRRKKKE